MTSMSNKILVVEDEAQLAELMLDYLRDAGYDPHWLDQGLAVVDHVRNEPPDLMLLDLMLPGKDGIEICREVRAFSDVPIIMATARVDEIDRLLGLELGADDYICKPYSPREVVARIRAIFRRVGRQEASALQAESADRGLEIDRDRMSVALNGKTLDLTPVEFRLLDHLAQSNGRVFSRDQLLDQLYDDHRVVTDRTVDSHVKNLRKKLSAASPEQEFIRSVYGVGYKFELPA